MSMSTRTPILEGMKRGSAWAGSRLSSCVAWLPVPLFLALIGYLHMVPRVEVPTPPWLLPALNLVFSILAPLAAAAVAAGSHLTGGHSSSLPAGAGLLAIGLAGLLSTLQLQAHHFAAGSIIGFLGYALAGACSLWAVLRFFHPPRRPARPAWISLLAGYGAVLLGLSAIGWAAYAGMLPSSAILGRGPAPLRQAVAGAAIGGLSLASFGLLIAYRRRRLTCLLLSASGLALSAVGLLGAGAYPVPAAAGLSAAGADPTGPLAVTGHAALYLGVLYLLVSMILALRQEGGWSVPLETLRETHQWYTRLVDTHPDAILVSSAGLCLFANPAAARLFGAPAPQELVGRPVVELVHPGSRPLVETYLREVLAHQQPGRPQEVRLKRLDGLPVEAELNAVRVEHKGRSALQVVLRDIRLRKQAEQALRESREDLNHAQAVARIGSWRLELASGELLWSDECCRIFEVPAGTRMTYTTFLDRVHPEDRAYVDRKWAEALQGEPYDIEHRILAGGGVKWVHEQAELELDRDGKLRSGFGTAQDITARRRAEETLRVLQGKLEAEIADVNILHRLSSRFIEGGDLSSLLQEVVESAAAITGSGKAVFQLLDPQTGLLKIVAQKGCSAAALEFFAAVEAMGSSAYGAALRRLERTVLADITRSSVFRGTGALQILLDEGIRAAQFTPLVSRAGRLLGMISTCYSRVHAPTKRELRILDILARQAADILERKQGEEALQQLNRSLDEKVAERTAEVVEKARQLRVFALQLSEAEERERKRIASLLHDDLQQVLVGARLQLQAGRQGLAANSPLSPILQSADRLLDESLQKARRLTRDLSPPVLHQAGLEAALRWLCGRMQEQYGLKVAMETDGWQDGAAEPMKLFLYRSAQELLFNVVKHARTDHAVLSLSTEDRRLTVAVSDRGRGIDPHVLDAPESGYGLFSIRERVEAAGGTLRVEGTAGAGSRLLLTLPCGAADEGPAAEASAAERSGPVHSVPAPASGPRAACRVLFADDHRVMREGLIAMVRNRPDIRVVGEAADGREALELARELRPDVVVMDVSMPHMDGIEATRCIKAEMPEMRVIGLSMFEEGEVARRMREAGAEAFVSKTEPSGSLLRAIYGTGEPAG